MVDTYPGPPTDAVEEDCRPYTNPWPTAATLLNGIVFKQVSEDMADWTNRDSQGSGGPIPPGWCFSASVGEVIPLQAGVEGLNGADRGSGGTASRLVRRMVAQSNS